MYTDGPKKQTGRKHSRMQKFLIFVSEQWFLITLLAATVALLAWLENRRAGKGISPHALTTMVNHDAAVVIDLRDKADFDNGHTVFAKNGIGTFIDSIKGIWIHGTYEIFAMVIEAAAGYIIGASILFPGSLKRMESFKKGIRDAFFIFISTLPFTIVAAFLEGYVTRFYNSIPAVLCFAIIFTCLFSISYYYLILPYKVAIKHQKR